MAKTVFIVTGENDESVGLWGAHAKITIEDNCTKHDDDVINEFIEGIKLMYEDEIGLTIEKQFLDEKKMSFYKCGHNSDMLIIKDSPLTLSEYFCWSETEGYAGTKEKCFKCWCIQQRESEKKCQ